MKQIFSIILLFIGLNSALSQEIVFTAGVNKKKVALNDYFQVTFTIKNADGKKFKAPAFKDFKLLAGPSTSSSFQSINGVVSRSSSYTYTLQPTKTGKFTINSASCTVKGEKITSNSIAIEVVKSQSSGSKQSSPGKQQKSTDRKRLVNN